jgi:hypothetical protein
MTYRRSILLYKSPPLVPSPSCGNPGGKGGNNRIKELITVEENQSLKKIPSDDVIIQVEIIQTAGTIQIENGDQYPPPFLSGAFELPYFTQEMFYFDQCF